MLRRILYEVVLTLVALAALAALAVGAVATADEEGDCPDGPAPAIGS